MFHLRTNYSSCTFLLLQQYFVIVTEVCSQYSEICLTEKSEIEVYFQGRLDACVVTIPTWQEEMEHHQPAIFVVSVDLSHPAFSFAGCSTHMTHRSTSAREDATRLGGTRKGLAFPLCSCPLALGCTLPAFCVTRRTRDTAPKEKGHVIQPYPP
jgi:hypothetical protein